MVSYKRNNMIKKLMIVIWFGEYPDWLNNWVANMEYLKPYGYDYLIFSNLRLFEQRVRDKLGIEPCIIEGTGKPWDYRGSLGILFEEEIKGYDYYGHTDFDCVYGDINKFMPDEELVKWDIWSNHKNYICGPWTLYKNIKKVNELFLECPDWEERIEEPQATGWIEKGYSSTVDRLHHEGQINRLYTHYQTRDPNLWKDMTFKDGKLYDARVEVMTLHFNRFKIYPLQEDEL
jgi:hypothetical protein